MGISIETFHPAHYSQLRLREPDRRSLEALENMDELMEVYSARGLAWTGRVDGEVLAIGGVARLWPGVGEAWMLASKDVPRHARDFHRTVKGLLELAKTSMQLHRLQTAVRWASDDQEGNRTRLKWALALGFESEGLMLCYGANGDHWLRVAWIRN